MQDKKSTLEILRSDLYDLNGCSYFNENSTYELTRIIQNAKSHIQQMSNQGMTVSRLNRALRGLEPVSGKVRKTYKEDCFNDSKKETFQQLTELISFIEYEIQNI